MLCTLALQCCHSILFSAALVVVNVRFAHCLQGLANMLWSYAKLPVAPPAVVNALVARITDQLVLQGQRPDGASTFDAQVCRLS